MFDIGVTKLAIVGGIALIVIGPERLPGVARMVGTLLGRAQRYVADVKAEVNRSIEIEELAKMKSQFEGAARDVHDHVQRSMRDPGELGDPGMAQVSDAAAMRPLGLAPPIYQLPRKKWRLKRSAMPAWYKRQAGIRTNAQSGAARVARFRPRRPGGSL